MRNFQLKNPTKIIFGKGELPKMAAELPKDAKMLLLYGGGSIKKNGIYDFVGMMAHKKIIASLWKKILPSMIDCYKLV